MRRAALIALIALGAAGCAAAAEPTLSPRQLLIRASLDLTGVRPSIADHERLDADPDALPALLAGYLDDPRFAERMQALWTPILRTRIDQYALSADDFGLADDAAFQAAIGEEVPRILGRIAGEDLPYTELVAGDWTMADESLAMAWPLERADEGAGWRVARYTDGRPMAGILSTNSLWWRYPSNGVNGNRGRANALSRILLCNDYLGREVVFPRDIDLTDPALVDDALRTNPGCVNCHLSLDPLASYLFGFQYGASPEATDASRYHPERERMWQETSGVAPGYYGEPGWTLTDLGRQIAADPRFVTCAVQTLFEGLVARDHGLADTDALAAHREAFLDGGLTLRALATSILDDPAWRGEAGDERNAAVRKLVTPDVFASQLEELTGYRFTVAGRDMMESDLYGLRSLGGGVDGASGAEAARVPSPSMVLVHDRLAQAAAWHVTGADAQLPIPQRRLLRDVDFSERPDIDRAPMEAQVIRFHRAIFGTLPARDSAEVTEALLLWTDLFAVGGDALNAWAGVLSVLLRDPDVILY